MYVVRNPSMALGIFVFMLLSTDTICRPRIGRCFQCFACFLNMLMSKKRRSVNGFDGPSRLKEVWKVCRKYSVEFPSETDFMAESYDERTAFKRT